MIKFHKYLLIVNITVFADMNPFAKLGFVNVFYMYTDFVC
jgi:hypothetical protein